MAGKDEEVSWPAEMACGLARQQDARRRLHGDRLHASKLPRLCGAAEQPPTRVP